MLLRKLSIALDPTLDLALLERQMAIIRSSVFLRRVVEKEHLTQDPEFGASPLPGTPPIGGVPADVVSSAESLKGAVTVAPSEFYRDQ